MSHAAPGSRSAGRKPLRRLAMAAMALALMPTGPAFAGGPRQGCFVRDYTDAHLARHPDQIVDRIALRIRKDDYGDIVADMRVLLARQGHVARSGHGGQSMEQFLFCWTEGKKTGCSVECDGGHFTITRDTGKVLTFRTDYLMVGDTDECGGAVDLAEIPGQAVSSRLDRASTAVCDGM